MGSRPTGERVAAQVSSALARVFDIQPKAVPARARGVARADLIVAVGGQTFVVGWTPHAGAARVAAAANQIAQYANKLRRRATPLVVAPFMGQAGRRVCEQARVAWLDLSGNARIIAPGIRIIVDGRPNRFRRRGRPSNVFAPKSARVARWLLMHAGEAFTQRQVARATNMTEGFVSRIVSRLEQDDYVTREPTGAVRAKDPQLLLDAWRESYEFGKHTLIQGHVAARSGDTLARHVGDTLAAEKIEHAATGLAAAWQLTHFAAFRIATFFVREEPTEALKEALGFREDARGANLWLVVPKDEGVFDGSEDRDGLRCVHPVQAYLDLKQHPERAAEAADRLRSELLTRRP